MLPRVDLRLAAADALERLGVGSRTSDPPEVVAAVREIIADVRARGDDALLELTARFDGCRLERLEVPRAEWGRAWSQAGRELQDALDAAAGRIRAYHEVQRPGAPGRLVADGIEVRDRTVPVARAGLYVPGGRAAYPSTVLMTGIPAHVAGVSEVVLCVPPGPDGRVPGPTLAAAHLAAVDRVFAVGGAQAIAAMAYGTASIPPVDVVVGPGNAYVSMAKREVAGAGVVGIEAPAGPSELVVIADAGAPATAVALDLMAQAEHGPGGLAVLATWSEKLADAVDAALAELVQRSPRRAEIEATLRTGGHAVITADPEAALDVANRLAPEHLELMVRDDLADELAAEVRNAGAVFVGYAAATAIGDYYAGANHVLPTGRAARFASALRVDDFLTHVHEVRVTADGLKHAAGPVAVLARAEGLEAHAASVEEREVT